MKKLFAFVSMRRTAILFGAATLFPCVSSSQILSTADAVGKKVLFVVGEPDKEKMSDDDLVKRHFKKMGLVVTLASASDPETAALNQDVIVISSTTNPHELGSKYRDSAVPVFTWNVTNYPDMSMTGSRMHQDFEVVDPVQSYARSFSGNYGYITSATHEISREIGAKSQMFGALYMMPETYGWGRPCAGGTVLANYEGDPRKAAIFTYEKGASLCNGRVAPARRVGFYIQDDTFHVLTEAHGPAEHDPDIAAWWIGMKLFDASLRWALTTPASVASPDFASLHSHLADVARGKKVLFVRRINGGEGRIADDHIAAYLQGLGFQVTQADQTSPQTVAAGNDLILLSSTNSKFKMANKYGGLAIPILCLEGMSSDILRLAGKVRYVDYGEHGELRESEDPEESYLDIVASYHPLAAGLKPGKFRFVTEPGVLKWATPTPGATVIATLPNEQNEAAIFGYEKGAAMDGGYLAPARRSLFPLDNPAFDTLTTEGKALFDAIVLWTIDSPQ